MRVDLAAIRAPGLLSLAGTVAAAALAAPTFVWLHARGLVTGPPWLLVVLTVAVVVCGQRSGQELIGGGRMDNRPVARLALAFGLFAGYTWTAGWSMVLPATAILVAVVHIQRSGSWVWLPAVLLLAGMTAAGQIGVAVGLVSTVVPEAVSHVGATAVFLLAASGVLTVGLTVAERERVEATLARTDARLRALMDSASDVLTVSDVQHRLTYVSPAVERTLGRRQLDLLGTDLLALVDPEHRDRAGLQLDRVIAAGAGARGSFDVLVPQPSGARRWYEWSVHNLLGDPLVEGLVIEQRDVTQRLQHQAELAHAAAHDELTGLPNRSGLLPRLEAVLAQAAVGAGVGVLFLDLDRFKQVNDTRGHAAGDAVLVAIAGRLRAGLRPHDYLARISGDEFCAILTEVRDAAEVEGVVARLTEVCDQPVSIPGGATLAVGASIGTALAFRPTDAGALLGQADADMYRVKRSRRWHAADRAVRPGLHLAEPLDLGLGEAAAGDLGAG